MPIVPSNFRPPLWLRNSHVQTIWPALARPRPELPSVWEKVELADGDFLEVSWFPGEIPAHGEPWLLYLHGLEGDLDSHYARPIIATMLDTGYKVGFMHLRGSGREPNRLARTYHSGASLDLELLLDALAKQDRPAPVAMVGISLGANVMLKWLGEQGDAARTERALAISPPFELGRASDKMGRGFSRLYQHYLMRCLHSSYQRKFDTRDDGPVREVRRLKNFRDFDTLVTAPLNGFRDASHYYQLSSCRQFLSDITRPTLILHARDDPFMYRDAIPGEHELAPAVTLELSEHGGHVGFVAGSRRYWLDQRIANWLTNGA